MSTPSAHARTHRRCCTEMRMRGILISARCMAWASPGIPPSPGGTTQASDSSPNLFRTWNLPPAQLIAPGAGGPFFSAPQTQSIEPVTGCVGHCQLKGPAAIDPRWSDCALVQ